MAYETEYTDFDPQEDSSACLTLGLAYSHHYLG